MRARWVRRYKARVRRLSPGRLATGLRERLRSARYLIADVLFAIGSALGAAAGFLRRGIRAVGRGLAAVWDGLTIEGRRRLLAALAAAIAVALFIGLAVPNLPCYFPAGDRCPPDDDAAEIVPASALAYVHLNADPETDQVEQLSQIAERFPLISRQLGAQLVAPAPGEESGIPDFRREIEPWFGGEAALALLPSPARNTEQVTLLEVEDEKRAAEYARGLAAGRVERQRYRGIEIAIDQRGTVTARVEGFLVVGQTGGVRGIIDTATGAKGSEPLAEDDAAEEIRDELPDHRFLEAWFSRAGADLISEGSTFGGPLALFVSPGSTRGAAAALAAGEDSVELAIRSELDPKREKARPGFFAAFPTFEADLPERLSPDALAYLGLGEPGRTVRALLRQAATQAPGIASGFDDLVESLRKEGTLDVEKDLLPALGDEAAFAIEPERGGGAAGPGGLPYLVFVAEGVDEERARRALADLQRPLAAAADPDTGPQAPVFGERTVDDVEIRTLRVTPTLELAYAIFDGIAVIATSPAGAERMVTDDGGLDSEDLFERATDDFEDELSLLAFLDLRQLIQEGFEAGLAEVPAFVTFSEELRRLEALGLSVRTEDDLLTTDARLLVSD
jgi:hypothetical protein